MCTVHPKRIDLKRPPQSALAMSRNLKRTSTSLTFWSWTENLEMKIPLQTIPRISFEVLLSVLTSKIFGKKKNNQRDHSYNLNTVFIIPMEKCDKNVNSQQEEIFFIIFPNKDLFSRSKGAISPLCNCSDSFSIVKLTFLCKEKIPPQMHAVVWHVKSEAWKVTY